MKNFWLFRTRDTGLTTARRVGFWTWNGLLLLLSGVGLGLVSLLLAYGGYATAMFRSYLEHPLILFLNLLPPVLLVAVLYGLIGRAWIAFLVDAVVVYGFSAANYYMLRFRDDPLMFEDLKYIREAGSITQMADYDLTPDKRMLVGIFCILVGTVFLALLVRGRPGWKVRAGITGAGILLSAAAWGLYTDQGIYNQRTQNFDYINRWSSTQLYISKGFVYPFLHSVTVGSIAPPEGYDEGETAALLESYTPVDLPQEKQVDLITLQLEAFADFSLFEGVEGIDWEKAYGIYHQLEQESYTGDLITNIFAGGTVDTERAFLTGYADLWNFRTNTNSYAWYLTSQGYVAEGSHPSYDWFYNRRNVNSYLGISNYYFLENHYQTLSPGAIATDDILLPEIYDLYAANRDGEGKPYFSFNVTYQGHGPYDTQSVWRGQHYTDGRYSPETTNIVDNYLGSVADTAEQLAALMDAFREEERPVVLVAFGDHKPWLGDSNSAYQELGVNLDTSTQEGFYNYYGTRYLIWANDAAKAALGRDLTGEGPDVSSCFLMNLVFDLLGWQGDAWAQATTEIWRQLPVLTSVGRYVENGQLVEEQDLSEQGRALLATYRSLEYYQGTHFGYKGDGAS